MRELSRPPQVAAFLGVRVYKSAVQEAATTGCEFKLVCFDFATKTEQAIELSEFKAATERGDFVWIDVEFKDAEQARLQVEALGLFNEELIEDALYNEPSTRLARYKEHLHLVVSGCRERGMDFDLERVDVVIGSQYLVTLHQGKVRFMAGVRRDYSSDFRQFAKSPSFLVYEILDHLIDNYLSVQKLMEERVEALQDELREDNVDDDVFRRISELGADLLHFRKILLPARSVLSDLSVRRTLFISEATQPFLANMVGMVENVLQDLLVDREILSESLNLYMSMVSHRTNEVMKRLTVVSVIFLPLTFLVGVYGMNFDVLPELKWHYGYLFFWVVAVGVVGLLLFLMRRARLL